MPIYRTLSVVFFLNDCGYIFCSKCWGKKPTKLLSSLICAEAQKFSEDGYEQHMQVNHLAPSLLSVLLLPSLIRGSPSRVINVNSVVSVSLTLQAPSMCSLVSMLFGMSKCWRISDLYLYFMIWKALVLSIDCRTYRQIM